MIRRVLCVCLLAACGDNMAGDPGFDSEFDDQEHTRFFGVAFDAPTPPAEIQPLAGAEVCIDDACVTTNTDGVFVVVGPGPEQEAILTAKGGNNVPTIMPVIGGVAGDRNVAPVLVVRELTVQQAALGFGVDPMLGSSGAVLVFANQYDTRVVELGIDGHATHYLDNQLLPDPARTTLAEAGGALIFGLPPGEAILRTTIGHCHVTQNGWPGAAGELRLPIVAGSLTLVNPTCVGE